MGSCRGLSSPQVGLHFATPTSAALPHSFVTFEKTIWHRFEGRMQLLSLAALVVAAASSPIPSQKEQEGLVASLSALKPQPAKKWNLPPLETKSVGVVQQLHRMSSNINGHH